MPFDVWVCRYVLLPHRLRCGLVSYPRDVLSVFFPVDSPTMTLSGTDTSISSVAFLAWVGFGVAAAAHVLGLVVLTWTRLRVYRWPAKLALTAGTLSVVCLHWLSVR